VIGLDGGQAGQVGGIRVNGKGVNDYLNTPLAVGPFVQADKLICNPAATLSNTDDN
jgi:hypothetical protein